MKFRREGDVIEVLYLDGSDPTEAAIKAARVMNKRFSRTSQL